VQQAGKANGDEGDGGVITTNRAEHPSLVAPRGIAC
jgi:hypothetical protein